VKRPTVGDAAWCTGGGHGGVAQLVEHLLCKQGVVGSNPVASIPAFVTFGSLRKGVGGPVRRDPRFQNRRSGLGSREGCPGWRVIFDR